MLYKCTYIHPFTIVNHIIPNSMSLSYRGRKVEKYEKVVPLLTTRGRKRPSERQFILTKV